MARNAPVLRIPFVVDSQEFRTNLGINNLGGVVAVVQISLVDHNGLLIAQTSTTVPPFGMRQINNIARVLESASTVTGREGYLILESNEDIRAWASQIDNATADPSLELARSDSAARVLMPSSVSSSRFSTSLIVINTTATDGQVNLRIRDSAGTILASLMNRPIAGYGYLFFEDIHKAAGLSNAFGPIEIEALTASASWRRSTLPQASAPAPILKGWIQTPQAELSCCLIQWTTQSFERISESTIWERQRPMSPSDCSTRMVCRSELLPPLCLRAG